MASHTHALTRPQRVFVICAAIFLTALIIAEATAGKFFTAFELPFTIRLFNQSFDSVVMTAGVLAFPITFIATDVINEYFGRAGIRFVTFTGLAMIVFAFALLRIAMAVPTASISPVPAAAFDAVFGTTTRVIFASLVAYLIGQMVDIAIFHRLRQWTDGKHLWLRATGSTLGSQFIDTFIVLAIAFFGQLAFADIVAITAFNYGYKLVIAIGITPLIYLAHGVIDRYLGENVAESMIELAEHDEQVL